MTAVAFHFNAAEPLHYGCRLLRKALRTGARLMVTGPAQRLAELDRMLWTFEPLEFVPHWRGVSIEALPTALARTPVVLVERPVPSEGDAGHRVLVNLGAAVPEGYAHFDRLVEIVGRSDDDRQAARARWRLYAGAGHRVEGHEVPA